MACAPSHNIATKHAGGRPREYDRMKIVHEFVEYARNNPDCLTVPCFTTTIGITSGKMREWAGECEEFRLAFHEGKELIGINRLKAVAKEQLERSMYSQVVGNFDIDINMYIREEKRYESSLKAQENQAITDIEKEKLDAYINAINDGQSRARSISDNKSNADNKS